MTLAAIFCGLAVLASARREDSQARLAPRVRVPAAVAAVLVALIAVGGLLGEMSVSASTSAAEAAQWPEAEADARRAHDLAPWSSEPWRKLGEAQVQENKLADAAASFREAIALAPGLDALVRAWDCEQGPGAPPCARGGAAAQPLRPEIEEFERDNPA